MESFKYRLGICKEKDGVTGNQQIWKEKYNASKDYKLILNFETKFLYMY